MEELPLYLRSTDFDPNKLTKAEISSILSSHGIFIPTTSKKNVLVEAFEEHVGRNREKLVKERLKKTAKASSVGIVRENGVPLPSMKTPTRGSDTPVRSGRRSRSTSKTRTRSKSPLLVSPSVKRKSAASKPTNNVIEKVVFDFDTDDNPFQSDREGDDDTFVVRKPKSIKKPVQKVLESQSRVSALLDKPSQTQIRPVIIKRKPEKVGESFVSKLIWTLSRMFYLLLVFGISAGVGTFSFFKWYSPIPFCSSSTSSRTMASSIRESLLNAIVPACLPCPLHASCRPDYNTIECEAGFHAVSPFYSLLWKCVPDRKQQAVIDKLAYMIQDSLDKHAGHLYCKISNPAALEDDNSVGRKLDYAIEKNRLSDIVKAQVHAKKDDPIKFTMYFEKAIELIRKEPKKFSIKITSGPDENLSLESLSPKIPFGCRLKKEILTAWHKYQYYLYAFAVTMIASALARRSWNRKSLQNRTVDELVEQVLELLVEQEKRHRQAPMNYTASLSVTQLRDSLCQPHSFEYKCWEKVYEKISRNTNVLESTMLLKGEPHRVWEWSGSDLLSPKKRR